MKKSTIFFIASVICYVVFIVGYIAGLNTVVTFVFLGLGCGFLFAGRTQKKKEDSGNEKTQQ